MIGKLSGIIDSFADNHVILDVSGVGYVVFASRRTLSRIGQTGGAASLLIDTHVREDHIHLYGFADAVEQRWFRLLTSVQGVGAKVALSILSSCPAEKLGVIIASQDKAAMTAAEGVGPKLGVRILTELKDKAGKIEIPLTLHPSPLKERESARSVQGEGNDVASDAVSALVNLGYARADAYTAVAKAAQNANDNLQDLIRLALKELSA
ncbi:MAG: Holliday junction branch migration protein RuvA [Alphaproteobacteria bacterium]